MLINLWVKDKKDGSIHQVGTNSHDSIHYAQGKAIYYNMQNGGSAGFGNDDEYEFVEPPDLEDYVSLTPDQLYLTKS